MPRPNRNPLNHRKWSKDTVRSGLRMMLQKYVGDQYTKNHLKDESYVLSSQQFKTAVATARENLKLDLATTPPPANNEKLTQWTVSTLSRGRVTDENHKNYRRYQKQFDTEVLRATKSAGLSKDWRHYVGDYIIYQKQPKKPLFIFPKTIWIEEVTEDDELIIKLKPGLRYDDYINAWEVFSRYLGSGTRLKKRRSDDELDLKMVADKNTGMTYLEITRRYYPNADPSLNIEKVKKRVQRAKRRLSGDK